jgi:hypothetical protein
MERVYSEKTYEWQTMDHFMFASFQNSFFNIIDCICPKLPVDDPFHTIWNNAIQHGLTKESNSKILHQILNIDVGGYPRWLPHDTYAM